MGAKKMKFVVPLLWTICCIMVHANVVEECDKAGSTSSLHVGIVLDESGSMGLGSRWSGVQSSVRRLIEQTFTPSSTKKVHGTFVYFNDNAQVAVSLTSDKSTMLSALKSAPAGGTTCIGCGMIAACSIMGRSSSEKKSLIVITDGQENESPSINVARPYCQRNGIWIVSIGLYGGTTGGNVEHNFNSETELDNAVCDIADESKEEECKDISSCGDCTSTSGCVWCGASESGTGTCVDSGLCASAQKNCEPGYDVGLSDLLFGQPDEHGCVALSVKLTLVSQQDGITYPARVEFSVKQDPSSACQGDIPVKVLPLVDVQEQTVTVKVSCSGRASAKVISLGGAVETSLKNNEVDTSHGCQSEIKPMRVPVGLFPVMPLKGLAIQVLVGGGSNVKINTANAQALPGDVFETKNLELSGGGDSIKATSNGGSPVTLSTLLKSSDPVGKIIAFICNIPKSKCGVEYGQSSKTEGLQYVLIGAPNDFSFKLTPFNALKENSVFSEVLGALKFDFLVEASASASWDSHDEGSRAKVLIKIEVSFNDWKLTVSGGILFQKQGFTASVSGELSFTIPIGTFATSTVKKMCTSYCRSLLGSTFSKIIDNIPEVNADLAGNLGLTGVGSGSSDLEPLKVDQWQVQFLPSVKFYPDIKPPFGIELELHIYLELSYHGTFFQNPKHEWGGCVHTGGKLRFAIGTDSFNIGVDHKFQTTLVGSCKNPPRRRRRLIDNQAHLGNALFFPTDAQSSSFLDFKDSVLPMWSSAQIGDTILVVHRAATNSLHHLSFYASTLRKDIFESYKWKTHSPLPLSSLTWRPASSKSTKCTIDGKYSFSTWVYLEKSEVDDSINTRIVASLQRIRFDNVSQIKSFRVLAPNPDQGLFSAMAPLCFKKDHQLVIAQVLGGSNASNVVFSETLGSDGWSPFRHVPFSQIEPDPRYARAETFEALSDRTGSSFCIFAVLNSSKLVAFCRTLDESWVSASLGLVPFGTKITCSTAGPKVFLAVTTPLQQSAGLSIWNISLDATGNIQYSMQTLHIKNENRTTAFSKLLLRSSNLNYGNEHREFTMLVWQSSMSSTSFITALNGSWNPKPSTIVLTKAGDIMSRFDLHLRDPHSRLASDISKRQINVKVTHNQSVCDDTCDYDPSITNACFDGGEGATSGVCSLGTDCSRCGVRPAVCPGLYVRQQADGSFVAGFNMTELKMTGVTDSAIAYPNPYNSYETRYSHEFTNQYFCHFRVASAVGENLDVKLKSMKGTVNRSVFLSVNKVKDHGMYERPEYSWYSGYTHTNKYLWYNYTYARYTECPLNNDARYFPNPLPCYKTTDVDPISIVDGNQTSINELDITFGISRRSLDKHSFPYSTSNRMGGYVEDDLADNSLQIYIGTVNRNKTKLSTPASALWLVESHSIDGDDPSLIVVEHPLKHENIKTNITMFEGFHSTTTLGKEFIKRDYRICNEGQRPMAAAELLSFPLTSVYSGYYKWVMEGFCKDWEVVKSAEECSFAYKALEKSEVQPVKVNFAGLTSACYMQEGALKFNANQTGNSECSFINRCLCMDYGDENVIFSYYGKEAKFERDQVLLNAISGVQSDGRVETPMVMGSSCADVNLSSAVDPNPNIAASSLRLLWYRTPNPEDDIIRITAGLNIHVSNLQLKVDDTSGDVGVLLDVEPLFADPSLPFLTSMLFLTYRVTFRIFTNQYDQVPVELPTLKTNQERYRNYFHGFSDDDKTAYRKIFSFTAIPPPPPPQPYYINYGDWPFEIESKLEPLPLRVRTRQEQLWDQMIKLAPHGKLWVEATVEYDRMPSMPVLRPKTEKRVKRFVINFIPIVRIVALRLLYRGPNFVEIEVVFANDGQFPSTNVEFGVLITGRDDYSYKTTRIGSTSVQPGSNITELIRFEIPTVSTGVYQLCVKLIDSSRLGNGSSLSSFRSVNGNRCIPMPILSYAVLNAKSVDVTFRGNPEVKTSVENIFANISIQFHSINLFNGNFSTPLDLYVPIRESIYGWKTSGTCKHYINSYDECAEAFAALNRTLASPTNDYQDIAPFDPKGCYVDLDGLKLNARMTNTGNCTMHSKCLCRDAVCHTNKKSLLHLNSGVIKLPVGDAHARGEFYIKGNTTLKRDAIRLLYSETTCTAVFEVPKAYRNIISLAPISDDRLLRAHNGWRRNDSTALIPSKPLMPNQDTTTLVPSKTSVPSQDTTTSMPNQDTTTLVPSKTSVPNQDTTTSMPNQDTTTLVPSKTSVPSQDTTTSMPNQDTTTLVPSKTSVPSQDTTTSMPNQDTTTLVPSKTSVPSQDTTTLVPSKTSVPSQDTTTLVPSKTSVPSQDTTTSMPNQDTTTLVPSKTSVPSQDTTTSVPSKDMSAASMPKGEASSGEASSGEASSNVMGVLPLLAGFLVGIAFTLTVSFCYKKFCGSRKRMDWWKKKGYRNTWEDDSRRRRREKGKRKDTLIEMQQKNPIYNLNPVDASPGV